jgi:hypothetical protein
VACVDATSSSSSSFKTLFYLLLLAVAYFAGGYYYKNRTLGVHGIEAIPHGEFWQDFPHLARDGVRFTIQKVSYYSRKAVEFVQMKL